MRGILFNLLLCGMLVGLSGCSLLLPEISHQPVIRNPFPQLSRVAVAPFFNHSDEATVDGRAYAMAYFAELQATAGFEVVPLGVVEEAIIANRIDLNGAGEARRLAQILGVDAVVVGAVTDFSPYYPPRCGLHVEWYTANPGYHEIPAGYGLPWNTPEEEYIPDSLVYEAQMANARSQMAQQAPDCEGQSTALPAPPDVPPYLPTGAAQQADPFATKVQLAQQVEELPIGEMQPLSADGQGSTNTNETSKPIDASQSIVIDGTSPDACVTGGCPEPSFVAPGRPPCVPYHGPVLKHTRIYRGTDPDIAQALQGYVYFRNDARFGGWKSYLQRSDDFIRFCCHMHISEMLAARGGSRKTRVVWRWPDDR
ncbi:MAG: hypothetical protein GXP26_01930 [Planctomycetes bacterium]|nr:hypothetical protein [Planctomycetota bacterium]